MLPLLLVTPPPAPAAAAPEPGTGHKPPQPLFNEYAGNVPFRGEPSPHADFGQKPASPVPVSFPAPFVDTSTWPGKYQNPVKVVPPKPAEIPRPQDENWGSTPNTRCGRGDTAGSLPYPSGGPLRGGRREDSEPPPQKYEACPWGGGSEGHDASYQVHSKAASRENREQQCSKEMKKVLV